MSLRPAIRSPLVRAMRSPLARKAYGPAVVIPPATRDFALTGPTLPADITFTRASVGTYFDVAGVMQSAAINAPRFTYDPLTHAALGLMIEEARTNLMLQSAAFDLAPWSSTAAVATNTATAPDGTLTADTLTDNSAAAFQDRLQDVTVANDSAAYSFSIFVKKTSGGTSPTFGINLGLFNGAPTVAGGVRFNTDTGEIRASGSVPAFFRRIDAGAYWRIEAGINNNAAGNTLFRVSLFPAVAANGVVGDFASAVGSAVVWGAQLEVGISPSSYIPTLAVAATRSADNAVVTGAAFSGFWNQTQGTVQVEGRAPVIPATNPAVAFAAGNPLLAQAAANAMYSFCNTANSGALSTRVFVAGASVAPIDVLVVGTTGQVVRYVQAYAQDNFKAAANGVLGPTDTSGAVPVTTGLSIGSQSQAWVSASFYWNSTIKSFRYWNTRLTDAQLQALSAGQQPQPYVGPLDPFQTSLWAAYGVTKQLTAYVGPALKATRSSDSATLDINYLSTGGLDTQTMLAWAAGSTVTVNTWYDNTGNGRHQTQATVARQPRIATAGVYDGFLRFDGADDFMQTAASCTAAIPSISVAWRGVMRSAATGCICVLGPDIDSTKGFYILSAGSPTMRLAASNDAISGNGQTVAWAANDNTSDIEAGWLNRFDRSLSQAANFQAYFKAWRAGVAQNMGFIQQSFLGPTDTTFSAQRYTLGSYPNGAVPAVLNLKSFAMWEANKDADAVAISAAI